MPKILPIVQKVEFFDLNLPCPANVAAHFCTHESKKPLTVQPPFGRWVHHLLPSLLFFEIFSKPTNFGRVIWPNPAGVSQDKSLRASPRRDPPRPLAQGWLLSSQTACCSVAEAAACIAAAVLAAAAALRPRAARHPGVMAMATLLEAEARVFFPVGSGV